MIFQSRIHDTSHIESGPLTKDWTPLSAWTVTNQDGSAGPDSSSIPALPVGHDPESPELAEPVTDDQILSQVMQYPTDDLQKELGNLFDAAANESTTSASLPTDGTVEVLDTQALPADESPPAAVASIPRGEVASPAETALDTLEEGGESQPALEGHNMEIPKNPGAFPVKDKLVRSGALKDI